VVNLDQLQKIRDSEWDNLIICDAARFDYFEQEYRKFLSGHLERVISPATCTIDWMKKVWNGYYNITYFSAWPGANSKGIPRLGYTTRDHFKKIIDVWNFGWDEELGTTPPWNMNKAVLKELFYETPFDFLFGKPTIGRLIIHYMQPHQPFIGETKITFSVPKPTPNPEGTGLFRTSRKIRKLKIELETLKQAYRDNLRLVLEWTAKLTPFLRGRTVVTADHGNLFRDFQGHVGTYHPSRTAIGSNERLWNDPRLRAVPWLEVTTPKT